MNEELKLNFTDSSPAKETRGSVIGWGTMLQGGRSRVRFPMSLDSASNRNEYQESSWGVKGGRPVGA
jgi:hypothetical protein